MEFPTVVTNGHRVGMTLLLVPRRGMVDMFQTGIGHSQAQEITKCN